MKEKGEWKSWLKTQHSKRKILASSCITSWQIDGETMETVTDFIFVGSEITADGDYSHEIKRRLLLERKVMTNLDSILKSRNITNKGPSSQSYGFSSGHVWMWELDLGNQFWIFTGRTDAKAPILWLPDTKSRLTGKDPDAGKDWRWEKGTMEDEMVGWHHQHNGHEFEQVPGHGEGQGSLVCCSPRGHKE